MVPAETPDKTAALDRMGQTARAPETSTDQTVTQVVTEQAPVMVVMVALVMTANRVEMSHSPRRLARRTT